MKLRIVPYKRASKSAKLLAQVLSRRLGYKVWRGPARQDRTNLFWGFGHDKVYNFAKMAEKGVSCVPNTQAKEVAKAWLNEGKTVFARTAGGQAGSGITVCQPNSDLPDRPLYTQYVKKKQEFRVHVYNGKIVDVMEKRKRQGVDANPFIRSHNNGWVFCRKDIVEPEGLRQLALDAVAACGYIVGGVDIIYNEHYKKLYVLEVNSAPGLEPSTAELYANAIVNA